MLGRGVPRSAQTHLHGPGSAEPGQRMGPDSCRGVLHAQRPPGEHPIVRACRSSAGDIARRSTADMSSSWTTRRMLLLPMRPKDCNHAKNQSWELSPLFLSLSGVTYSTQLHPIAYLQKANISRCPGRLLRRMRAQSFCRTSCGRAMRRAGQRCRCRASGRGRSTRRGTT